MDKPLLKRYLSLLQRNRMDDGGMERGTALVLLLAITHQLSSHFLSVACAFFQKI